MDEEFRQCEDRKYTNVKCDPVTQVKLKSMPRMCPTNLVVKGKNEMHSWSTMAMGLTPESFAESPKGRRDGLVGWGGRKNGTSSTSGSSGWSSASVYSCT